MRKIIYSLLLLLNFPYVASEIITDHLINHPANASGWKTQRFRKPAPPVFPILCCGGVYIKNLDTIKVRHNSGFFSCCSVRLDHIVAYLNFYKRSPGIVDSSEQFSWYKPSHKKSSDITYDYFENNIHDEISYEGEVLFNPESQFLNYKDLNYTLLSPLINKYFTPSEEIKQIIKDMEVKYGLNDYEEICVLFYRGNDKITETNLSEYEAVIEKAQSVQEKNPNIKFLIQSDETEFISLMLEKFPSSFYFKDEIRHMNKCKSTVDKVFKDLNYDFSKYYLAITIMMSKCQYIVCGSSGNCSIWIMLYRNHANNVYQFLKDSWIE